MESVLLVLQGYLVQRAPRETEGQTELLEPQGSLASRDRLDRLDQQVREVTLDHKDRVELQALLVKKGPMGLRDKEERQVPLDSQVLTGPQVPLAPLDRKAKRAHQETQDHQVSRDLRVQPEIKDH